MPDRVFARGVHLATAHVSSRGLSQGSAGCYWLPSVEEGQAGDQRMSSLRVPSLGL